MQKNREVQPSNILCHILRQDKVKKGPSGNSLTAESTTSISFLDEIELCDSNTSALPHSYAVSTGTYLVHALSYIHPSYSTSSTWNQSRELN